MAGFDNPMMADNNWMPPVENASGMPQLPAPARPMQSAQPPMQHPAAPMMPHPQQSMRMQQMDYMQAVGDSPDGLGAEPTGSSHSLGLALLVVGVGAAAGAVYGGALGAVAGGLYGGAVVNGVRAASRAMNGIPDDDHEAIISGTYAVIGAGVATYLTYRVANKAPLDDKEESGLVGIK